jgi:histidinol-phosphate/aromatic aminotransferase/cobyric acid decarboxylase-like protein
MSVARLRDIPSFSIDRVRPLRATIPTFSASRTLTPTCPPPPAAVAATQAAIATDEANSWLPFSGRDDLKRAVAAYIERRGGPHYDGPREIVITPGEGIAMLDALFAVTDPGDEVVLTDPTYAGMINRVRLVGAVPKVVPLRPAEGSWRLDLNRLAAAVYARDARVLHQQRFVPERLGRLTGRMARHRRTRRQARPSPDLLVHIRGCPV